MFSSEISYMYEGTLQIFVEPFTKLDLDQTGHKIEFIAPATNSLTILHLVNEEMFVISADLSSNGNLAIIADAALEIADGANIEANQIFITNYAVNQANLGGPAIHFDGTSASEPIINRGNIIAKQAPSAIATSKFENHGNVSDEVDCKSFVGLDQAPAKQKP